MKYRKNSSIRISTSFKKPVCSNIFDRIAWFGKAFVILFIIFQLICDNSYGKIISGKCSPYYASIKSDRANAHVGPGKNYKLVCEYVRKGVPVIISAKYDHWRKITDPEGTVSWIHKSQLASKRFVITKSEKPCKLVSDSNDSSQSIAYIKKNVIMELSLIRGNWCEVEIKYNRKKYSGWIKKENLFGVFENETS